MMEFNKWYKRLRTVLELERRDVVEIMRIGGVVVTSSLVEGWAASESNTAKYRTMTADHFDAFTYGLVEWSKVRAAK